MAKQNMRASEDALAQARAELTERVLKKLNQGATFREIESIYGVGYREARTFISTLKVHMTVEEANFFRETAEHFGMLTPEAVVFFAKEGAQKAHRTRKGVSDSPLVAVRRADVVKQVYDKMIGNRGDLHLYPRPLTAKESPTKKDAASKDKSQK